MPLSALSSMMVYKYFVQLVLLLTVCSSHYYNSKPLFPPLKHLAQPVAMLVLHLREIPALSVLRLRDTEHISHANST